MLQKQYVLSMESKNHLTFYKKFNIFNNYNMKINKKWLLSVRTGQLSERIHLAQLENKWDASANNEKDFSKLLTHTYYVSL